MGNPSNSVCDAQSPQNNNTSVNAIKTACSQLSCASEAQDGANNLKSEHERMGQDYNEFWLKANNIIANSGKINAESCKIRVPSFWNVELFEELLYGYENQDIVQYMKFGWPVDFENVQNLEERPKNQKGAALNKNKVRNYVQSELNKGSIIGPFAKNPFGKKARFSPIDAIPKKDSDDIRIILNLSYPVKLGSVNEAMQKDWFRGKPIKLQYPGVDDLVRLIRKKGRGCLLFKTDLKRYYRQIFFDPCVVHLFGFSFEDELYFDVVLSMGLRIACFIAQTITNALMWIYKRLSYEGLNYLDDLGGAEIVDRAEQAYLALKNLLKELNIWEAADKACPPNPVMTFLGIRYDTKKFTIELTRERLKELETLLQAWLSKDTANLKQTQSLLGKLNFACATVRSGRVFLGRIIRFLMECPVSNEEIEISDEIKGDLNWWRNFISAYNGITMIPESRFSAPDRVISTDSSLKACGGWARGQYFHLPYSNKLLSNKSIHINELECLAVVVALKVWGESCRGKNLLLHCDNQSTVDVVNKGYARNNFSQQCLREIVWLSARYNLWIKVVHVRGVNNRLADLCSRFNLGKSFRETFREETKNWKTKEIKVGPELFEFENNW